jgi:hypothetical protein
MNIIGDVARQLFIPPASQFGEYYGEINAGSSNIVFYFQVNQENDAISIESDASTFFGPGVSNEASSAENIIVVSGAYTLDKD